MGRLKDVAIWENPNRNSLSETGPGKDTERYWILGKSPFPVQKAANTAFSLFFSNFTMQLPFAEYFLQDCTVGQQTDSAQGLLGNSQLTGAPVQQNDTPPDSVQAQSDEKMGVSASQSADGQAQHRFFVGTVIADKGANLRSGPGLEYAIVDKWSEGQQFPFEMASEDKEWLRINEGLWISASTVAEQEIYETFLPADGDSPEYPMPTIKISVLGLSFAIPEGNRIYLGSVSERDGANIRSGPGLEHEIVSAVSFGSLVA